MAIMPTFRIVLVAAVVVLAHSPAWALRCGTSIVEPGDKTVEVRKLCGEPASEEVVGYTLTRWGTRELLTREWAYPPRAGVRDYLTFHGTTLVRIELRRHR